MTDAEHFHEANEKLYRQHEGQLSPEALQSAYEACRWLIQVRTGEIQPRYRKMLLSNGEPVEPPKPAA